MADGKQADTGWLARAKQAAKSFVTGSETGQDMTGNDYGYGYDTVSVSTLLGSGKRPARSRVQIYEKYHYMAGDPIISAALRLHVVAALGGHETTGDTVFVEKTPEAEKEKGYKAKIAEELKRDLEPLLNRVAHQISFNGASFGDAYARAYTKDKVGVVDLYTDEMVYPPLVQPYEQGNQTVGFIISTGSKFTEKLTLKQMVRLKMPRMLYVPQMRVMDKAIRMNIAEDDIENLAPLPAMVGGSFLDPAEEAFDNLSTTLQGMIGQRILSSIDENMIGANLDGMTAQQRAEFMKSLKAMLVASKTRAEKAIADGKPVTERIYHIMPTFGDKQMTQISSFTGTSGNSAIAVDDVIFHAKRLAGALGTDLSMLGFSDILSGGLGDGGFFRTSAQSAERSRIIRTALTEFYHSVVDLHTLAKYGFIFDDGDRPYKINYYGSISALENEQMQSRERSMNSASMLVQTLDSMKNLGMPETANKQVLEKVMELDADMAGIISNGLANAKPPEGAGGGFGGGGFGGDDDLATPGEDKPAGDAKKPDFGTEGEDDGK